MAAASALGAVFNGYGWLFPVLGAVIVVVVVAELVRWSPIPSGLAPLLAAGAVLCYLTATDTGSLAHGRVIPSSASLRALGDIARSGFHDVHELATPVPTHRGLVLLATVGIAAVALVVDLLAVTMRRAALAGLPLLAIFALCTSIAHSGAGWVPFVIGAVGYLWLLLVDSRDRLSRWGRPLGFDRGEQPRFTWSDLDVMPSPLSVMGRRIGLTAITVGLVVPLLIPGLRGGVPHNNGNGLGFGNGSKAVTVNPIVTIQGFIGANVVQTVLTYKSTDPTPPYLRLTALDDFDGTTFKPVTLSADAQAEVSNGITAPAAVGPQQQTSVDVSDLKVHWLPIPQQVQAVQVPGDWRYDSPTNTIFSSRDDTQNLQYSVESVTPNPTANELNSATTVDPSVLDDTKLPTIPQSVQNLTQQVTKNATTQFQKAVAIQDFLTSSAFVYDINAVQPDSTNALADFLLRSRRGFCQQFASAMVVMARLERIPARVAVGFTRGTQQSDGSWAVTTKDAHAWPELWFDNIGWIPFEPTPRGDGQAVEPAYTQSTPQTSGNGQNGQTQGKGKGGGKKPDTGPAKNHQLDGYVDGNAKAGGSQFAAPPPKHSHTRAIVGLVAACILAALLVLPVLARTVTRRRRWRRALTPVQRADAAWAELRASAIDARAGWIDGLSPRATARVLRAESAGFAPPEIRSLDHIVEAVQRAWYAASPGSGRGDTLEDDVDAVRAALVIDATAWERLTLKLWPRSTLREARELVGRLGGALDAVDLFGARARARLRARLSH